jgi:hypothetical protein
MLYNDQRQRNAITQTKPEPTPHLRRALRGISRKKSHNHQTQIYCTVQQRKQCNAMQKAAPQPQAMPVREGNINSKFSMHHPSAYTLDPNLSSPLPFLLFRFFAFPFFFIRSLRSLGGVCVR